VRATGCALELKVRQPPIEKRPGRWVRLNATKLGPSYPGADTVAEIRQHEALGMRLVSEETPRALFFKRTSATRSATSSLRRSAAAKPSKSSARSRRFSSEALSGATIRRRSSTSNALFFGAAPSLLPPDPREGAIDHAVSSRRLESGVAVGDGDRREFASNGRRPIAVREICQVRRKGRGLGRQRLLNKRRGRQTGVSL